MKVWQEALLACNPNLIIKSADDESITLTTSDYRIVIAKEKDEYWILAYKNNEFCSFQNYKLFSQTMESLAFYNFPPKSDRTDELQHANELLYRPHWKLKSILLFSIVILALIFSTMVIYNMITP